MTVAQLINRLKEFRQELEVFAIDDLGHLSEPSIDVRLVADGWGEVWVISQERADAREALIIE